MKPFTISRPWGSMRQFTLNEPTTVKIITVLPEQELSLQFHKQRSEFWKVLKGKPTITIGDSAVEAKVDDEFFIEAGTKHRIRANDSEAYILEISFGTFDEEDIVRLEDKYGRA